MDTRNYRYGLTKAINMINIQQITIKFKFQQYRHYTYILKGKKMLQF